MYGFVTRLAGRLGPGLALAACLAGCTGKIDKAAGADVVVFLNAARTGDRATFEAHIDRITARDDLRAQLDQLPGVKDLQAQLGEGMAEGALDRLISPETVLRLEGAKDGAPASTLDEVRSRLRAAGKGRICLRDAEVKSRCALTFAKVGEAWKLVGLYVERQSFDPPNPHPTPVIPSSDEAVD